MDAISMEMAVRHLGGIIIFKGSSDRDISVRKIFRPSDAKPGSKEWLSAIDSECERLRRRGAVIVDAGVGPESPAVAHALSELAKEEHAVLLRSLNFALTLEGMRRFPVEDQMIIQAVAMHDELAKVCNRLVSRLREWVYWSVPEAKIVHDNRRFAEMVSGMTAEEMEGELISSIRTRDISLSPFGAKHFMWESIQLVAEKIVSLYRLRDDVEKEMDSVMQKVCPNLREVAGTLIGAKLLVHAGSLRRLCSMPASTIQLLGAEKALFRHLSTGARCPKHGLIVQHPLVASSGREKGRAARMLADKIAIASRLDYFGGGFKGDKLRKELEEKLS